MECVKPAIQVVDTDQYVSVMLVNGVFPAGVANMDYLPEDGFWWLARINIKLKYRGQGYGRKLIEALKEKRNGKPIVVCPGGYDISQEEQHQFYRRCGFVEKDGYMVYPDVDVEIKF